MQDQLEILRRSGEEGKLKEKEQELQRVSDDMKTRQAQHNKTIEFQQEKKKAGNRG